MHFRDVPIPERMRRLERDHRGYPIPVIVLRDSLGNPHFTANADEVARRMVMEDRCSICGTPHTRRRWFVGGPFSAFHADGAYFDPPLHADCMRYALQVCPWMAIVRFKSRIDGGTLSVEEIENTRLFVDRTQIPGKPLVFVAVGADGQEVYDRGYTLVVIPKRPHASLEYWRDGLKLDRGEGEAWATTALRSDPKVAGRWEIPGQSGRGGKHHADHSGARAQEPRRGRAGALLPLREADAVLVPAGERGVL